MGFVEIRPWWFRHIFKKAQLVIAQYLYCYNYLMEFGFLLNLAISGVLWWVAVYLLSRNLNSRIALVSFAFLTCLSIFLTAVNISRNIVTYDYYENVWHVTEWSYLLPIALIFHFSILATRSEKKEVNQLNCHSEHLLPDYMIFRLLPVQEHQPILLYEL